MLLVIDNYDSFTFNLVQYLGEMGVELVVHRNDQISLDQIQAVQPDRMPVRRGAQRDQVGVIAAVMLQTAIIVDDVVAQHSPQFGVGLGAMRPQRVEQGDVAAGDAGRLQFAQQDRHDPVIGGRARDVAVHDHHPLPFRDELRQRCEALEGQVAALRSGLEQWATTGDLREYCSACEDELPDHSAMPFGSSQECPVEKLLIDTESTARARDERIRAEATAELRRELEEYESCIASIARLSPKPGLGGSDAAAYARAVERVAARKGKR